MNADLLLAHFDRIAKAPHAVPSLRAFVLDLAIRGKLVVQDPNDEAASELLKRIQARRDVLLRSKAIRPTRAEYGRIGVGDDFPLPTGWVRTTINETCDLQTGATPDRTRPDYFGGNIRWLVSGDVNKGEIAECEGRITELGLDSSNCKVLPVDSVLMALNGQGKTRATVALLRVPAACNQSLVAIIPLLRDCLIPEYLFWNLRSRYRVIRDLTGQDDRRGLNMKLIWCFAVSIPPVPEQRRIIAKLEELMVLCDQMEAAKTREELQRDLVVAASLFHIDNSKDSETIRRNGVFYLSHLPHLTSRPEQVMQLRQTILNLAVRGRLVCQDASHEPAENLIARVVAEQQDLSKGGIIPRRKSSKSLDTVDLTFELPNGWSAVFFGALCNVVTSGSRGWAEYYADSGPKFVRAQNIRFGKLRLDDLACVNPPKKSEGTRTQVSKGDLLVVITGAGVTNPALLDVDLGEAYVSQHVALIKPTDTNLSPWLLLCLMAPMGGRAELVKRAYGAGKPGLNLDNIRSLPIPLPPLAEQRRILEKVSALMDVCDQLETQLSIARTESHRLLDSILHHAIADAEKTVPLIPALFEAHGGALMETKRGVL